MTSEQIALNVLAAREKLVRPKRRPASALGALAAAALMAISAFSLAAAIILGPGEAAKDAGPPTIFGER